LYNLGANSCGEPTTNNLVADPCEVTNIYDPVTPPEDLVTHLKDLKSCAGVTCRQAEDEQ